MEKVDLGYNLYEKMSYEQDDFRKWLLSQPPEEILNHAYEYAMREDILMAMETEELTDAQAQALLRSRTPLADVYREFDKLESAHMDEIRSCIESRANYICKVLEEQPPCASALREDLTDDTGPRTVRDFLAAHIGDVFSLMTPCGFVPLTAAQAEGLMSGQSAVAHPGVPGITMSLSADDLLSQAVNSANYTNGVWHLLTEYPEMKQPSTEEKLSPLPQENMDLEI